MKSTAPDPAVSENEGCKHEEVFGKKEKNDVSTPDLKFSAN